ncbi:MAG: OmpA family protein [Burkholderiales bacterium]
MDPRSHEQVKDRIKRELATDANVSLAQADVGYYLDVLQGRLNQVATRDIVVGRKADRVTVDLSVVAGFEPGGVQVAARLREALKPLAEVFAEYRTTMVSLRVRADDADMPSSRSDLGAQRALAVARFLASAGVAAGRIVIVGPETGPNATDNASRDGRTHIELWLEPIVRSAGG